MAAAERGPGGDLPSADPFAGAEPRLPSPVPSRRGCGGGSGGSGDGGGGCGSGGCGDGGCGDGGRGGLPRPAGEQRPGEVTAPSHVRPPAPPVPESRSCSSPGHGFEVEGVLGSEMMAAGSSNPYFEHENGSDGMDNGLGGAGLEMILLPVQPDATASDVSVHEPVDWDALQIIETIDDEGRLEVPSDEQMYVGLGLAAEDERAKKATEAAATRSASRPPNIDVGVDGAAIPVDDFIPNERVIAYDPGALFPFMEKFRLAVRQYAFNEEFELDVRKSTPTRYDGYCLGSTECSWHVHARPERRGGDTIIVGIYSKAFHFSTLLSQIRGSNTSEQITHESPGVVTRREW
ncbi:hypothetical protein ACP4OV_012321 [Aristida adscensionis]